MTPLSMRRFKVISLFSGGMGLDLGLEATGHFEVVACVEKVPAFCETIRKNRDAGRLPRNLKVFEGDIRSIAAEDVLNAVGLKVGEVDLIVGGPPCQSFSTAGRRGTVQDPRGTLLWDFLRFVDACRPKFFLMENVRGLLSAGLMHRRIADRPEKGGAPLGIDEEPGSVVRLFARDLGLLKDCSYHLDIFEVNAVNYGAPQIRERALFIGNRLGTIVDFPNPTHGPASKNGSDGDLLGLFPEQQLRCWVTLGDVIKGLKDDNPCLLDFSPRKKGYLSLIPPGSNWRSLPVELQKESMGKAWHAKGGRSGWWRRLTFDLPCPTLVTMPNHASTALCHPVETRVLSLREYGRIQEFPDEWEFCGSTSERYAQVGNAVPTRLGKVAGTVIADALRSSANAGGNGTVLPIEPRVVYLQSHVRTRQWFKDGEAVVWDDKNGSAAAYSPPRTLRRVRTLQKN